MVFFICSRIESSKLEDDLFIPKLGECQLECVNRIGTLMFKVKKEKRSYDDKFKGNMIGGICNIDETVITYKVNFLHSFKVRVEFK
jgi:hypothetical protein